MNADAPETSSIAPRWQGRVEAACVTLACGGPGTGYRTKLALLHPAVPGGNPQQYDADAQKRAADVLYEVILSLVDLVPGLPAQIERRLADLALDREGEIDRGDRSLPPPPGGFELIQHTEENVRRWSEAQSNRAG